MVKVESLQDSDQQAGGGERGGKMKKCKEGETSFTDFKCFPIREEYRYYV